jgi:putative transposase
MSTKTTDKGIKKFSKEEKFAVLDEGKRNGIKVTLAKYSLFPAMYHYWRKKFNVYGEEGLTHQVVKENEALKLMLAEKELQSRLKDDLLKKKYPELRKRH